MRQSPHRRFSRRPRRTDDEDRILPLINIVFLLLIFFMAVGRLSATDPFRITPPISASEGAPATEPMLIAVGTEGRLALNGEVLEEADLLARISEAEPTEIRIKSDGGVEALRVVGLLTQLKELGVSSVRLMTVPERQGQSG